MLSASIFLDVIRNAYWQLLGLHEMNTLKKWLVGATQPLVTPHGLSQHLALTRIHRSGLSLAALSVPDPLATRRHRQSLPAPDLAS